MAWASLMAWMRICLRSFSGRVPSQEARYAAELPVSRPSSTVCAAGSKPIPKAAAVMAADISARSSSMAYF